MLLWEVKPSENIHLATSFVCKGPVDVLRAISGQTQIEVTSGIRNRRSIAPALTKAKRVRG
jgi:hypothetical protein